MTFTNLLILEEVSIFWSW